MRSLDVNPYIQLSACLKSGAFIDDRIQHFDLILANLISLNNEKGTQSPDFVKKFHSPLMFGIDDEKMSSLKRTQSLRPYLCL